ncbi:TPA: hypothetical protein DCX16_04495 [bacterium]|nr:hypothetical protein [bacterium]
MKFAILFLVLPFLVFAKIEETKKKLIKLQDEIKKTEEGLKKIEKSKKEALNKLDALEKKQKTRKIKLKKIDNDIKKISKKIEITEEAINTLTEQIISRKSSLSFLVKEMFFLQNEKIFLQKDPSEKEIAIETLMDEFCTSIGIKEGQKKVEFTKKEGLKTIFGKTQEEKKTVVSGIKKGEIEEISQKKLLSDIKSDEDGLKKKITKLKSDQKKLEVLIKQLEGERKVAKKDTPSKLKDSFTWPTKSRNIVRAFGRYTHPEANTIMISKGIEIAAPLGSGVFAIGDGEIVYSDWFMGYGRLIMIDHDEGVYSLYAHLNNFSVKQGQKVTRGEKIGDVGKSGDVERPILHFEIRVHGEPVNPLDWLP